jgi:hypothetical protein
MSWAAIWCEAVRERAENMFPSSAAHSVDAVESDQSDFEGEEHDDDSGNELQDGG